MIPGEPDQKFCLLTLVWSTYSASAWVAHNEKMVTGLKKTLAVHDSPEIVDGTVVQV